MGVITIDTGKIVNFLFACLAVVGLAAILIFGIAAIFNHGEPQILATSTSNQVTTIAYPSVLTFTALTTTTSTGRYQVTTTNGNILYFPDYYTWNQIEPRGTYTATLVGMEGSAYQVGTVIMISSPYNYYGDSYGNSYYNNGYYNDEYHGRSIIQDTLTYWHYGNRYYQCDRSYCDELATKQIRGETVYDGRPPRPVRNGASY